MPTVAETLGRFALRLSAGDVPDDVVLLAKGPSLDTFWIALASPRTDFGAAAHAAGRTLGVGDEATALGFGTRLPAASAALGNGTLAHGLDFEDTHVEAN